MPIVIRIFTLVCLCLATFSSLSCSGSRQFGLRTPVPVTKLDGPRSVIAGEPYVFTITSASFEKGVASTELEPATTFVEDDEPFVIYVQDYRQGFEYNYHLSAPPPKFIREEKVERYVVFDSPGSWTIKSVNAADREPKFESYVEIPPSVELTVEVKSKQ